MEMARRLNYRASPALLLKQVHTHEHSRQATKETALRARYLLTLVLAAFIPAGASAAPRIPDVTVVNAATNPVPVVQTVIREPFKVVGQFSFEIGETFADVELELPEGRIAVIEMVTATFVLAEDDSAVLASLFAAANGIERSQFYLRPVPTAPGHYVVSQQVRLYSSPGQAGGAVVFRAERTGGKTTRRTGIVRISGYTVPADSPTLSP